jgi:hypothetical protein
VREGRFEETFRTRFNLVRVGRIERDDRPARCRPSAFKKLIEGFAKENVAGSS